MQKQILVLETHKTGTFSCKCNDVFHGKPEMDRHSPAYVSSSFRVTGVQASSLCISNEFVYALTPEGKMYVRYAITATNPAGNYWKEIPGRFMAFAGILLTH